MAKAAKHDDMPGISGIGLLDDPVLNRGTAFTAAERERHGLDGLLPPTVETIERQLERVMGHLEQKPSDLERYVYLMGLCDRNETLFYKTLMSDPARFVPIVYDPTIADACLTFGHLYRRTRGMYVTRDMKGRMAEVLRNWPQRDVRFICVSTGGRILGLGDIGANGMGIPIGKLQLYTACAAVPPDCCLPVLFDIGTTNAPMRADPLYLGLREAPPASEDETRRLVDEFVAAANEVFPGVCVHFEDWKGTDAIRLLTRYSDKILCYNDDIQGTASVTIAGLTTALQISGTKLKDQRIFFLGAGSAGIGIANMIVEAMVDEGLKREDARKQIALFDVDGLIESSREDLSPSQKVYAQEAEPTKDLKTAVEAFKPTVLIGVSTMGGAFTEAVIRGDGEERRPADHLPAVEPDRQGGMHARAGLHVDRRQGAGRLRGAVPGRNGGRQDVSPRTGQQLLHLPRDRPCGLCHPPEAHHRQDVHRGRSCQRRSGEP